MFKKNKTSRRGVGLNNLVEKNQKKTWRPLTKRAFAIPLVRNGNKTKGSTVVRDQKCDRESPEPGKEGVENFRSGRAG